MWFFTRYSPIFTNIHQYSPIHIHQLLPNQIHSSWVFFFTHFILRWPKKEKPPSRYRNYPKSSSHQKVFGKCSCWNLPLQTMFWKFSLTIWPFLCREASSWAMRYRVTKLCIAWSRRRWRTSSEGNVTSAIRLPYGCTQWYKRCRPVLVDQLSFVQISFFSTVTMTARIPSPHMQMTNQRSIKQHPLSRFLLVVPVRSSFEQRSNRKDKSNIRKLFSHLYMAPCWSWNQVCKKAIFILSPRRDQRKCVSIWPFVVIQPSPGYDVIILGGIVVYIK